MIFKNGSKKVIAGCTQASVSASIIPEEVIEEDRSEILLILLVAGSIITILCNVVVGERVATRGNFCAIKAVAALHKRSNREQWSSSLVIFVVINNRTLGVMCCDTVGVTEFIMVGYKIVALFFVADRKSVV